MRRRSLAALCLALAPVIGLAQSPFRHAWRFEKNDTVLISTFTAPPPFSLSGEPEATLTVEASRLGVERPSLEAIIERCLQKDPSQRYQSVTGALAAGSLPSRGARHRLGRKRRRKKHPDIYSHTAYCCS